MLSNNKDNPSVLVIGAGMTGIMLVIKLREAGINNVTLLEKKDSVGGTWRENTYPGVACDVPSHAYTYSFAPNPQWSSLFAPGHEIHKYFDRVSKEYSVQDCIRFNEGVTRCDYSNGKWMVESSRGNRYEVDLLFAATGMLHKPVVPDISGKDSFKGEQFHSAEWDHSTELKGKRIAVIGTGSSAAQLIPELIDTKGSEVNVFQRTPQWIVKTRNKPYSDKQRQHFEKNPAKVARTKRFALMIFEKGTTALTSDKFFDRIMHKLMAWNASSYLKKTALFIV